MKKTYAFLIFSIFTIALKAQYKHVFISEPDSAAVYVSGDLRGYTPCEIKFSWRDAINKKLTFTVEKEGYKTWTYSITRKPSKLKFSKNIYLDPDYEIFNLDSNSQLIDFDKLVIKFPEGKTIGQKIYLNKEKEAIQWDGSINASDDYFHKKFYEVSRNMGFRNYLTEQSELFSSEIRSRSRLPRFVLGAEIVDYSITSKEILKKKRYLTGDFRVKTEMGIQWSVLDKSIGKVISTELVKVHFSNIEKKHAHYERYRILFELSLIKFLGTQKFIDLVQSTASVAIDTISSNKNEMRLIKNASTPTFNQNSEMIKFVNESCVTVITDGGHGSGVIITESGYLLSAYHVVEGVNKIDVKFSNGLTLQANIIAFDLAKDVVLLQLNGSGFQALPIVVDEVPALGDDVFTIGTPASLDLGQSISKGIVSGKRKLDGQVYIQADISVSPGNSGGPLINDKGEIIGIIQRKIMREGVEGIGFAIPIEEALQGLNVKLN